MNPVIMYTLFVLGGISFILGAVLAFASQKFNVEVNPEVTEILDILPNANCGGCGYAGCAVYAESVVRDGVPTTLCAPGGADLALKIAQILGREAKTEVRKVAYLHCAGSKSNAKDKHIYDGVDDCRYAVLLGGGQKACEYGCVGFGTCVKACKFDALHMGNDGLPVVDRDKCTACGACVRSCPHNLFELIPDTTLIYLACSSHDKGKAVKDVCSVGCIACGICAKVTEEEAIVMENNLPYINYDVSPNLTLAWYKCPTKSYIDLAVKRAHMSIDTKCKGHGKCVEVCPVKDCITGNPGERHYIDPVKCIGCGFCLSVCPEKAIHVVGAMGYLNYDV